MCLPRWSGEHRLRPRMSPASVLQSVHSRRLPSGCIGLARSTRPAPSIVALLLRAALVGRTLSPGRRLHTPRPSARIVRRR